MPHKAPTPIHSGNQDSTAQAFQAYADLTRQHAREPDLWEAPERMQARRDAHANFLASFGGGQ